LFNLNFLINGKTMDLNHGEMIRMQIDYLSPVNRFSSVCV
jgi:hypothetical protein